MRFRESFAVRLLVTLAGLGSMAGPPLQAQSTGLTVTSLITDGPIVAPGSIAMATGSNLATTTASANMGSSAADLPINLGGIRLEFRDSGNNLFNPGLLMVSPGQINFVVPANAVLGSATVSVVNAPAARSGTALVSNIAPSVFTANPSGTGLAAAQVQRVDGASVTFDDTFTGTVPPFSAKPISLTGGGQVYLVLYATGLRRKSLNPAIARVDNVNVPVVYAGPQGQFPGLDQINIGPLPQSLAGRGTVNVVVTVDGVPANAVQVAF